MAAVLFNCQGAVLRCGAKLRAAEKLLLRCRPKPGAGRSSPLPVPLLERAPWVLGLIVVDATSRPRRRGRFLAREFPGAQCFRGFEPKSWREIAIGQRRSAPPPSPAAAAGAWCGAGRFGGGMKRYCEQAREREN